MVGSNNSETRYKLCRDMPMEKGPIFEEWLKEFLDAAGGEGDDDASWAQSDSRRHRSPRGPIGS